MYLLNSDGVWVDKDRRPIILAYTYRACRDDEITEEELQVFEAIISKGEDMLVANHIQKPSLEVIKDEFSDVENIDRVIEMLEEQELE